jgi:hypothetical protein
MQIVVFLANIHEVDFEIVCFGIGSYFLKS